MIEVIIMFEDDEGVWQRVYIYLITEIAVEVLELIK